MDNAVLLRVYPVIGIYHLNKFPLYQNKEKIHFNRFRKSNATHKKYD